MAGGKRTSVLFFFAFLNKTVYFGHRLCGAERDARRERIYEAAGESVKNRQLHRQKQDAESVHLLKERKGKEGGWGRDRSRETEKTEAINSQMVH